MHTNHSPKKAQKSMSATQIVVQPHKSNAQPGKLRVQTGQLVVVRAQPREFGQLSDLSWDATFKRSRRER